MCGVSEFALDLGGKVAPSGFHGQDLCSLVYILLTARLLSSHPVPCASQFPVSCAVRVLPWNRIIVENMVKYFHLTKSLCFSP